MLSTRIVSVSTSGYSRFISINILSPISKSQFRSKDSMVVCLELELTINHSPFLGITFSDHGQLLPRPAFGSLEGKSENTFDCWSCEDGYICSYAKGLICVRDSTVACVFAFRV